MSETPCPFCGQIHGTACNPDMAEGYSDPEKDREGCTVTMKNNEGQAAVYLYDGELTPDDLAVLGKMMVGFGMYLERNRERGLTWKRSGILGTVFMLMTKADRAFQQAFAYQQMPNADHFIDAIVYGAFGLIHLDENNRTGVWPWER